MAIDEEKQDLAIEIAKDAERSVKSMMAESGLSALMASIPVVGGAVTEMLTVLAFKRTNEHMHDMFEHFTNRIRQIGEDKVSPEWFKSEEFQSLMFEAIHQLHATHDS